MKDYNGFPPEFRTKVYNLQKGMGLMVPIGKMACSICGGSGGLMMGHSENYYDLYDLRPVCVECHMKLHARFSRPRTWANHLHDVSRGIRPRQWKTVGEYFSQQTKSVSETPLENFLKEIYPGLFGDQWFCLLLLTKIDIYSPGSRRIPEPYNL